MTFFIFLAMIFCHVLSDYTLQGCLAHFKQKDWWRKNYPDRMYENDYKIALWTHAFSWTFVMMLPVVAYRNFDFSVWFFVLFLINWIVHTLVDDMKSNYKFINLTQDQLTHLIQIIITWLFLVVLY